MKARLLALAVLLLIPMISLGQVLSATQNVTLSADLIESLSVALTGGSAVTFRLAPGEVSTVNKTIAIETTWVLDARRTAVRLVAYFDTPNALTATTSTTANIQSSLVLGRMTTGLPTTYTPFNATVPGIGTAGASLLLFSENITAANDEKTRRDNLDLEIDLSAITQQPAGGYAGTLHIQAIAL
jgi:hypothetical protein